MLGLTKQAIQARLKEGESSRMFLEKRISLGGGGGGNLLHSQKVIAYPSHLED